MDLILAFVFTFVHPAPMHYDAPVKTIPIIAEPSDDVLARYEWSADR